MYKTWIDAYIVRWNTLTGKSEYWKILKTVLVTVNKIYVKIVGSYANYCKPKIIILSITE